MIRLNLGCGANKIEGFVNIDSEKTCKPDLVWDFVKKKLPYKDNSVTEVVFFHCIEHINKRRHKAILQEIFRVLKPKSRLIISYPEFTLCYKNWNTNYRGKREFWEATIFGRQLYPSDYHVCAMHTPDFKNLLLDCGFIEIVHQSEPREKHYSVVTSIKGQKPKQYEDLIRDDMNQVKFKKVKK